jgi:two-component system sensor histidine kinase MprB
LTLAAGGAVFVALVAVSLVVYFSVRANLRDQIDVSLIDEAQNVATKISASAKQVKAPAGKEPHPTKGGLPLQPVLTPSGAGYFQVITSLGTVSKQGTGAPAPVTTTTKSGAIELPSPKTQAVANPNRFVPLDGDDALVAAGVAPPYFRDVRYHGTPMRLYTMRLSGTADGLVRTARPLGEANATISRVRWLLIALTLGGAFAAALLGRLAAATVLRPVRTLAAAVRDVTATRDLNRRIPVDGRDEVGSLAGDFNEMLAALEESQRAQQQLIADASHELRTPLTAHRANIELLARGDLPSSKRPQVLKAAVRGIDELSTLIGDLIQAARNGKAVDAREPVALDDVVAASVERARRRAPHLRFETKLEPYTVTGSRIRVERAVDNVLDNALKWSTDGGRVEVALCAGVLRIRDGGPGIDDGDLPHVFDRFYRAAAARGLPGSGLGLAIVRQTVEDHGGSVEIENAAGGGTVVSLRFGPLTNL